VYQLIVVDNASTDGTKDYLQELQQNWKSDNILTLVHNTANLGYAAGNNQAIPRLQGTYTLFLNQDIILTNRAVDYLVEWFETHPRYGAVAPLLRYPDGTIQASCRRLPTLKSVITATLQGKWEDVFDYEVSQDCEQPMASAIMLPTKVVADIGGFDDHPDFWLFFNDVDLSKQLKEKGYRTHFLVDSVMIHHHGSSTNTLLNIKKRQYWHKGFKRYFFKWHGKTVFSKIRIVLVADILFALLLLRDAIRFLQLRLR
jgi:GT2 family glycosyltransferase